jgi:GTP pyrophosphokinase
MVKTNRAKKQIKILCTQREKELNELSGKNILNTIFAKYKPNIVDLYNIEHVYRIPLLLDFLKHTKKLVEKKIQENMSFVARFKMPTTKLKEYTFENILLYSNYSINSLTFEHCCHPKFGDDIVAFKEGNKAVIHHKMCDKAYKKIKSNKEMLFSKWIENKLYQYKMVVSLPNTKGELARLLTYMSQYEGYILSVSYGRESHSYIQYCDIEFEINKKNRDEVRKLIEQKVKVIEFFSKKDAYNKN